MKNKKIIIFLRSVMCLLIAFTVICGVADYIIPERLARYTWQNSGGHFLELKLTGGNAVEAAALEGDDTDAINKYEATVSLLGAVPLKKVEYTVYDHIMLCPGGMPFGVKIYTDGLIVTGVGTVTSGGSEVSPAASCGIRAGDVIVKVNGKSCSSADNFLKAVEASQGECMTLEYRRGENNITAQVTPVYSDSDGGWRTGMWLRDSSAGIGTVTFVDPTTGAFAGLGHGICDSDTGSVMPLARGIVVDVAIAGITKGVSGTPGELIGSFKSGKTGTLIGNTESGVFGVFSTLPQLGEALPIALASEVKEGEAYIYCTLDGTGIHKYTVRIENIARPGTSVKNFTIRVTDPTLLELTGGIIQGMSGSPVIQNGKIIGALTHVLINDPSAGYGIFIENMLAEMPDLLI